jgi:hypothetical protein
MHNSLMPDGAWRTFEDLSSRIQAELAPNATVTKNEKLVGQSGEEHQCDVVIRSTVGQLPFTCVFECKDWKKPVNLNTVRSFASAVADLRVSQGVIVSAKGFTKPAKRYAAKQGILTYTLFDAHSVKWAEQALVPVLLVRIDFRAATIHVLDSETRTEIALPGTPEESFLVELRRSATGETVPLCALMQFKWDEVLDSKIIPRPDRVFETEPGEYILCDGTGRSVVVSFNFEPDEGFYFNHVALASGQGFREEQRGRILSSRYQSATLDLHRALTEWPRITDPAKLAVHPELTFFAIGHLTRASQSPRYVVFGKRA